MTNEEALSEIEKMVYRNTDNFEMVISKGCYKTIIEALEKQIPKKPLPDNRYYGHGKCPQLPQNFVDLSRNTALQFGQAIDWTE